MIRTVIPDSKFAEGRFHGRGTKKLYRPGFVHSSGIHTGARRGPGGMGRHLGISVFLKNLQRWNGPEEKRDDGEICLFLISGFKKQKILEFFSKISLLLFLFF